MLTVGQLIAEKERLEGVVNGAADARAALTKLDRALNLLGYALPADAARAKAFPCPNACGKAYTTKSALNKHVKDAHGGDLTTGNGTGSNCPHCEFVALNGTGLSAHIRIKHKAAAAA